MDTSNFMQAQYAHYIIFGSAILALIYAAYCFLAVKKVEMNKEAVKVAQLSDKEKEELMAMNHQRMPPQT